MQARTSPRPMVQPMTKRGTATSNVGGIRARGPPPALLLLGAQAHTSPRPITMVMVMVTTLPLPPAMQWRNATTIWTQPRSHLVRKWPPSCCSCWTMLTVFQASCARLSTTVMRGRERMKGFTQWRSLCEMKGVRRGWNSARDILHTDGINRSGLCNQDGWEATAPRNPAMDARETLSEVAVATDVNIQAGTGLLHVQPLGEKSDRVSLAIELNSGA